MSAVDSAIRPAGFLRTAPVGDAALAIYFEAEISRQTNLRVRSLASALREAAWPEIVALVPSYRSILVHYDPGTISYDDLSARIASLRTDASIGASPVRRWSVPVCYGSRFGSDLENLALRLGMSTDEVVSVHSAVEYMVYMIGFSPGFAYLGELPERLEIPRKAVPVANVPSNAIQVGGKQTAVSSMPMPSGWYIVGQTPLRMFEPTREEPFLLKAGDYVCFQPIGERDFADIEREVDKGSYRPEREFGR